MDSYLDLVHENLLTRTGGRLADLVSLSDAHSRLPWVQKTSQTTIIQRLFDFGIREPWDDIVFEHLSVCQALGQGQCVKAYKSQTHLARLFSEEFKSHKERNWALPVLYSVARDLRLLAKQVDRLGGDASSSKFTNMEDAANILNECFRILSADVRSEVSNSKRLGMLYVANQLFKIYHYIERTSLCMSLFKAIDSLPNEIFYLFTKAQKVTYNFYAGRAYLYEGDTDRGLKCLRYSFEFCPREKTKNKRITAIFLTVAKMLMGNVPRYRMLQKYDITEYQGIAESIRSGDVRVYDSTVETHEETFHQWGVYWLIVKLQPLVYRTLFKRAAGVSCVGSPVGGATSLEVFTAALRVVGKCEDGEDCEHDITEAHLTNLIDMDLVKGYISHSHGKIVLSKGGAFVRLPLPIS